MKYSKLPTDPDTLVPVPVPLIPLQQEAYNSVFEHKRTYRPLHSYNPTSGTSKTPRDDSKKEVHIHEVPKQTCRKSPVFDKNGKRIKVPFRIYLHETRNDYCVSHRLHKHYVWDATIDKYCCSQNPENKLIRLKHLLDVLENGVGNVDVNSSNIQGFDLIKNEINKIFKFLFPDKTGFGFETDQRNFNIREEVNDKLDSLILENDTGEPTVPLLTLALKRLFDNYVAQMALNKTLPDIFNPEKAREVAVIIERIASDEYVKTPEAMGKKPTEAMKEKFIRMTLAALLEYKRPSTRTTTQTANAKWVNYERKGAGAAIFSPVGKGVVGSGGGRKYHLKKKYKSKSKPKSKVNTKRTRRIRRK